MTSRFIATPRVTSPRWMQPWRQWHRRTYRPSRGGLKNALAAAFGLCANRNSKPWMISASFSPATARGHIAKTGLTRCRGLSMPPSAFLRSSLPRGARAPCFWRTATSACRAPMLKLMWTWKRTWIKAPTYGGRGWTVPTMTLSLGRSWDRKPRHAISQSFGPG